MSLATSSMPWCWTTAPLPTTRSCTLDERLERLVYLSDGRPCAKYAAGRKLF